MGVLVVALNPSIDVEWRVRQVRWEEKNIVHSERRWPGGKGVNVARWLRHLGTKPLLLLPLGGETGKELAEGLRQERIPTKIIPLRESTRANVIVSQFRQGQLRFNAPGPRLSATECRDLFDGIGAELPHATLMVLSGSLPRGVRVTAYARLIRCARQAGVKTLLDCDGPAFAIALKARPFLVKPNVPELAQWWGGDLSTLADVQQAAIQLSGVTGGWVLVSRGDEGACLINRWYPCSMTAPAPRIKVRNTVGAGDALLAAVAREIESNRLPHEWLRAGVSVGTAAAQCAPGELPSQSSLRKVQVTEELMRNP